MVGNMALISFLNPLSSEGQNIVKEFGDLGTVFDKNDELVNIVMHSNRQTISKVSAIPETIGDLAIRRIEWYIERKNNKKYNSHDYAYLLNENIVEFDVIAFHMLSQAIAIHFNPNSRETRLFIESQGLLIEERLTKLLSAERKDMVDTILNNLLVQNGLEWTFIRELIATKKLSLTDLVLEGGEIVLDKEDFIGRFGDEFTDRSPERIYDILIGDNLKELILTKIIMQNTENYIRKIKEMSATVEIHPTIANLGDKLEKLISETMSMYSSYYAGAGVGGSMKIGKLIKEAFPPCISNTVNGVSSGGRNDAIVLLLTSFVSYARLFPGIFAYEGNVKVSDIDKNLAITNNEILPLIYEAADNCTPPLFEDQPQEKINIVSKLGFGMHDEVDIENEGETKWYTPMSCEKIKMHLPQLCKECKDCKNIGNPLSFYSRKKWILNKEGRIGKESENNNSSSDNSNKNNKNSSRNK